VLLIYAGLLIQRVRTLRGDPGFDPGKVVYFRMKPLMSGYDQAAAKAYFENVRRRLESLAEVPSVASARLPPALQIDPVSVSLPVGTSGESEVTLGVAQNTVTPGFFETLHVVSWTSVRGPKRPRRIGCRSEPGARRSALAEPGSRRRADAREWQTHHVIGVAACRDLGAGDGPAPFLFRVDSSVELSGRMLVRVKGDPGLAILQLRKEILAVNPGVAVAEALPLTRLVENLHAEVPLAMRVASFAGGLALLLSAIGLYSALAIAVSQRTREIGIRMALRARTSSVVGLVLRRGMTPALVGLGAGLVAAVNVSRPVSSFLLGWRRAIP